MRRALGRVAPLAVLATALLVLPGSGAGAQTPAPDRAQPPAPADLGRLQAELDTVTARAAELAAELASQAARDGGLTLALEQLADQQDAAQSRLDARARQAYIRAAPDPFAGLVGGLAADGLRALAAQELARRGSVAAVRAERRLLDAATEQSAATVALQAQAEAFRASLREQASAVLAAQDQARSLLAQAERAAAEQRTREAALQQAQQAQQLHQTQRARAAAASQASTAAQAAVSAQATRLAGSRSTLDAVSATLTRALTPAQTRRSINSQTREAPVLALVDAAGAGYPAGYAPTGTVLRGGASWYGPGFVGSPTASGTPYDPERMTCAHKSLPLGTVLRVTHGTLAVSCLVNDRGPYVGDRILDLSRAGSRALGYNGVAPVTAEVLALQ